jgi:hypothetical protein
MVSIRSVQSSNPRDTKFFKVVLSTIPIGRETSSTQIYRCTPRHLWPHIMIQRSQDNSKSVTDKPVNVTTFTNTKHITSTLTKPKVDPDGTLPYYHFLTSHIQRSTQSPRSILTAHYILPLFITPTPLYIYKTQ